MKRFAMNGLLISIALVLAFVERWFPLNLLVPLPGVKLGLANVVGMFALYYFRVSDAVLVTVFRCILAAFLFGNMTSLGYSLFGGLLALFSMFAVLRFGKRFFSIIGVGIAGAAAHNTGQILIASLTMKTFAVMGYLPVLLWASIATGTLTSLLAGLFFIYFERTGLVQRNRGHFTI